MNTLVNCISYYHIKIYASTPRNLIFIIILKQKHIYNHKAMIDDTNIFTYQHAQYNNLIPPPLLPTYWLSLFYRVYQKIRNNGMF